MEQLLCFGTLLVSSYLTVGINEYFGITSTLYRTGVYMGVWLPTFGTLMAGIELLSGNIDLKKKD